MDNNFSDNEFERSTNAQHSVASLVLVYFYLIKLQKPKFVLTISLYNLSLCLNIGTIGNY